MPGFHPAQRMSETVGDSSCVGSIVVSVPIVLRNELSCQQPDGEKRARVTGGFSFVMAVQESRGR